GWVQDFAQDLGYAFRIFLRNPGFTIVAVVSLALGIGASTAVLGAALSLFFGEMHLPDSERLANILTFPPGFASLGLSATVPDFVAWREQSKSFESMGASILSLQDFGADENGHNAERVTGHAVTSSLFDALHVQPLLGRVFYEDEVRTGFPSPFIVLSYGLWQRRFAGDPAILNREIVVNGQNLTVIGVMPSGF